jgi:rhamnosyltransferase
MKVAAYITCYQDLESIIKCIEAIKSQSVEVERIFIIDNSKSPLSFDSNDDKLFVSNYPDNIGISGGFSKALEWAIDKKYDFLWLFDQDSIPEQNCLKILLKMYYKLNKIGDYEIGIVAPVANDIRTGNIIEGAFFSKDHFKGVKHNNRVDYYECDSPITSGSLISLSSARKIPNTWLNLFIDGIDWDYGLQLKKKGYHNLIITNAFMDHNFGSPIKVKFMNRHRYLQQYSALRHYYISRNHTYLETRSSQGYYLYTSFIRRIKYLLSSIFWIGLYDGQNKCLKSWACLLGTYHGLIGKLGKLW